MERALAVAKKIIYQKIKYWVLLSSSNFSKFCEIYPFTNENINGYIGKIVFSENDMILSILSSGDHAFNLITSGALNIDAFDINYLTEYYALGLKRALIIRYSYDEFMRISKEMLKQLVHPMDIYDIINSALPFMDEKYRVFWRELIDFYIKTTIEFNSNANLFYLLKGAFFTSVEPKSLPLINNYLASRENYNLLKANLERANLSFKQANIRNLPKAFKGMNPQYNYTFLSNVLDYSYSYRIGRLKEKNLKEFANNIAKLSADDAEIYLHYVFVPDECLFKKSKISTDMFTEDEIITLGEFEKEKHLVLLKRVNNGEIKWKEQ